MAETGGFDREFGRIDGVFAAMREASQPVLAMLAETADKSLLPDEEWLAAEEARLAADLPERRAAETALARLVSGLASDIAFRKVEFDNREQPTRGERLLGYFSKAAMRRRMTARAANPAVLAHLEKLLVRGDALAGLIDGERTLLVTERKDGEGHLGTFIDHRSEIIKALRGEGGEAMNGVAATAKAERAASAFDRFVTEFNTRIAACNILRHKLIADMEDLLILYQVIFDALRRNDSVSFEHDRFPHLKPEIERFARGMLTMQGLAGRRQKADLAFGERFSEAAVADAGGERASSAKLGHPSQNILNQARS